MNNTHIIVTVLMGVNVRALVLWGFVAGSQKWVHTLFKWVLVKKKHLISYLSYSFFFSTWFCKRCWKQKWLANMISWKNENKMHTAEKPVIKIYVSRPDARKCELLLKGSITRSAMCLIHSTTCIQLLKIKFKGFFLWSSSDFSLVWGNARMFITQMVLWVLLK